MKTTITRPALAQLLADDWHLAGQRAISGGKVGMPSF